MTQQFAPMELCKKLQAMGCKSESGYFYQGFQNSERGIWFELLAEGNCYPGLIKYPAFVQNDFTGATEQADENCNIAFGNYFDEARMIIDTDVPSVGLPRWLYLKYRMVQCHISRNETWWQYLERTMRK